jgi:hypothetical protein
MNADEFLKQVTPAAQRSRLAPYGNDIAKLRDKGCSLEQVCQFLAANGVQITIAGLSKYLRKQTEKETSSTPAH